MPNPYQLDPPAGVWYARIYVGGRERRLSTGQYDQRKAAIWLKNKRAEVAAERAVLRTAKQLGMEGVGGAPVTRAKPVLLSAFLLDYEKHYKAKGGPELVDDREKAWLSEARTALTRFVRFAEEHGVYRVDRVTKALVMAFQRKRALDPGMKGGGLSNHTLRGNLKAIRTFFTHAVDVGIVKENPAYGVKPPPIVGYEIVFLGEPSVREVLERTRPYPLFPLIATALYAGLRAAELAALEWPDVRFDEGFISVRNKRRLADVREGFRTKSRKPRMVPLAPALAEILRPLRPKGGGSAGDLCFPAGRTGRRHVVQSLDHRVKRVVAAMNAARAAEAKGSRRGRKPPKVEPITFTLQVLRRTFGSLLLARGERLERISRWLGHSSVKITEAWYVGYDFGQSDIDGIARLDFRAAAPQGGAPDRDPDSRPTDATASRVITE